MWEYFARYPYMPRLRDESVLVAAVKDGISQLTWRENFAYAAAYQDAEPHYRGLLAGESGSVVIDSQSVLVRSDVAQRQVVKLEPQPTIIGPAPRGSGDGGQPGPQPPVTPTPPQPKMHRHFHGTVALDPMVLGSQAAKVAEHVVQYLSSLPNAAVRVTLEIQADLDDGAPEHNVRTVLENARTLKFTGAEFED